MCHHRCDFSDNVSVRVSAVVYFRVIDPDRAVIQVEDYFMAVSQFAQTTLRSVLGQHELDEMLAERTKLNAHIQQILDEHTSAGVLKLAWWKLSISILMKTWYARLQDRPKRNVNAARKVIHADGELQASHKLLEAAQVISQQKEALQLRYLQTLSNIGEEKNTTIVFPIPIDFLSSLIKK